MAKRLIYLARHCQTEDKWNNRLVGRSDVPLSDYGVQCAGKLRERLARIAPFHCVTSPLKRASETARIATETLGSALNADDNFREIDFGEWEGLTFEEICGLDKKLAGKWLNEDPDFGFPGGESVADFEKRTRVGYKKLMDSSHEKTVVFSHAGAIRLLICLFIGIDAKRHWSFRVDHGSITTIEIVEGRGTLIGLNDLCHLEKGN